MKNKEISSIPSRELLEVCLCLQEVSLTCLTTERETLLFHPLQKCH